MGPLGIECVNGVSVKLREQMHWYMHQRINKDFEERRYCTIDSQESRIARSTSGVSGHAGVFSGVARRDGIDRQQADAFVGDDRYIGKVMGDWLAIERPLDLYRMVSLQDGARRGHRLSPIRRFLTDHEGRNVRSNYSTIQMMNSRDQRLSTRRAKIARRLRPEKNLKDRD